MILEVINTRQTEIIIDIIRSFANYKITDFPIQSTVYSVFHATDAYQSNSYFLESGCLFRIKLFFYFRVITF